MIRRFTLLAIATLLPLTLTTALYAAVDVSASAPKITRQGQVKNTVQTVTLANAVTSYTLVYDFNTNSAKPGEATSHWWGWQNGYIPIGMTAPSNPNWYWQAFFNWRFDKEDLSKRPATFRVVRAGGEDGMIEFAWDTPKVKATIRFALTTGSDKLLMFGSYEPKTPVKRSYLTFSCYPASFATPHNRAVTTASGTTRVGGTVQLNLAKDRWVLYEDTTPDRPAYGSAGMIIGTPQSFNKITIPVGDYQIVTTAELKSDARSFALGLYDFPTLPDYQLTRAYFRQSGDREAQLLGKMAAGDLNQPLPPMPLNPARMAKIVALNEKVFERPSEVWRPNSKPLDFSWARSLPQGPINTAIFCPRWRAWETMELARRLDMKVQHLYFDDDQALSKPADWPYRGTTGNGPVPYGAALLRANQMIANPQTEVILCAGITGNAMPGVCRKEIAKRVSQGVGLLIVNPPNRMGGWQKDLFKTRDPQAAALVTANLAWQSVPGFRQGERGRVEHSPLVDVYRYGQGRVVVLHINQAPYSALVPLNDASEGLQGAMDRALAIAARAVRVAAHREAAWSMKLEISKGAQPQVRAIITPAAPAGSEVRYRVQDDLGNVVQQGGLGGEPLTSSHWTLTPLPAGRSYFVDALLHDHDGHCLAYAFAAIPTVAGPTASDITLAPAQERSQVKVPRVDLPQGGRLTCTAKLTGLKQAAIAHWQIHDALGRFLAEATTPAPAGASTISAMLTLPRPVTVEYILDLTLQVNNQVISRARKRFAVTMPYPYDDFTALLWSYPGGEPVLQRTDRACYELGADMMDLCHMGGYDDAQAAREYSLSARSGLRLVPYVTRIYGASNSKHWRVPCLDDPAYLQQTEKSLTITCRQAAVYSPAAYTLGDENRLNRNSDDVCSRPETVKVFANWLQLKYHTIEALNAVWDTHYKSFAEIQPMLLPQVAKQQVSFAPWIENKIFMDTAFANAHNRFAKVIQAQDPGAKVGWDGINSRGWQSGCDFYKLTRYLKLDQVYTSNWLAGELVRSFKQSDALSGKWGNGVADVEAGWHAFPWDCLLAGDNSVWWWTSWGVDYIPFNPDLSESNFGKWFFEAVKETTSGPGKLLLHARRDVPGVAVQHSQADKFAAAVAAQLTPGTPFAGAQAYSAEETALLRGLKDYGCQYQHFTPEQIAAGKLSAADYRILFLPFPTCVSDEEAAALRRFVEQGGTLVTDGRAGLLTGEGRLRTSRALDELLGIKGPAGLAAFKARPASVELSGQASLPGGGTVKLDKFSTSELEPGLKTTTGVALLQVHGSPLLIVNKVGQGRAITLNLPFLGLGDERTEPGLQPTEAILAAVLRSAGVQPFCELKGPAGQRPLCLQQIHYTDGSLHYLAIFQDILVRGLGVQKLHLTLPQAAYVYDLRAGKPLGQGKMKDWDITIDRGYPLVYSLLPYQVAAVTAQAPATAQPGMVTVRATVQPAGGATAGFHVVRMDVYAPKSDQPHRQYSQNIACPNGTGSATIPFCLSDPKGQWRLEFRDVATGVKTEKTLTLR